MFLLCLGPHPIAEFFKVAMHYLLGTAGVPCPKRLEHYTVTLRKLDEVMTRVHCRKQCPGRELEGIPEIDECAISRGLHDHAVERYIALGKASPVSAGRCGEHFVKQLC